MNKLLINIHQLTIIIIIWINSLMYSTVKIELFVLMEKKTKFKYLYNYVEKILWSEKSIPIIKV